MPRTSLRLATVAGLATTAVLQAPPATARPADNVAYDVSYETTVCDQPGTLDGRVFLNSRSTGSEGGTYTATFVERTTGTFTVGDDVYRYTQSSKFSEHEREDGDGASANHLIGTIRLSGNGPLAGRHLEQHINTVEDANGVTRVETSVSSFCE